MHCSRSPDWHSPGERPGQVPPRSLQHHGLAAKRAVLGIWQGGAGWLTGGGVPCHGLAEVAYERGCMQCGLRGSRHPRLIRRQQNPNKFPSPSSTPTPFPLSRSPLLGFLFLFRYPHPRAVSRFRWLCGIVFCSGFSNCARAPACLAIPATLALGFSALQQCLAHAGA